MALFDFGYKKKFEELKRSLEAEDYEEAARIADQIPEHRAETAPELNLLGKAYKHVGAYERAREMFEYAKELRCNRSVLTDLMDCCLEMNETEDTEVYFDEYCRLDPEDKVTQYIYRYRIEKKKGRERRMLISILEELKAMEYVEKYAYELAKQYHKAGMVSECMEECRDIISWFGSGDTVERAKALLAYYRGEINLEDIKAEGARYQKEQEEAPEEASEDVQEEVEEAVQDMPEESSEAVQESFIPEPGLEDEPGPEELFYMRPAESEWETENEELYRLLNQGNISATEILGNFARIKRLRMQVLSSLETLLSEEENAYLVVTGEEKSGKTTLALALIKLMFEMGLVQYDRTAGINALQLNQVSLEQYRDKLRNCNLVIKQAGSMTPESLQGILEMAKGNKGKTCVIFEDGLRNINRLQAENSASADVFSNRIRLGKYTPDELFGFAYEYIKKEDYSITKAAAEILYGIIYEIAGGCADEERLVMAMDVTKRALKNAEKRESGALLNMAAEGRIRQGIYLTILPEDLE